MDFHIGYFITKNAKKNDNMEIVFGGCIIMEKICSQQCESEETSLFYSAENSTIILRIESVNPNFNHEHKESICLSIHDAMYLKGKIDEFLYSHGYTF